MNDAFIARVRESVHMTDEHHECVQLIYSESHVAECLHMAGELVIMCYGDDTHELIDWPFYKATMVAHDALTDASTWAHVDQAETTETLTFAGADFAGAFADDYIGTIHFVFLLEPERYHAISNHFKEKWPLAKA